MVNEYSSTWFDLFLTRENDLKTRKEVQFILSQIRIGLDIKLLDIACGNGRHARKLAAYGLEIHGIDISDQMLDQAKKEVPEGRFYNHDMRKLHELGETGFDIVLIMWQSFGYFDDETNINILQQIFDLMKTGGTFILDIYNKVFFEQHQGVRVIDRGKQKIHETKFVKNNRLEVNLRYHGNIEEDTFNWRIYNKDEFLDIVGSIGFVTDLVCSNFDPLSKHDQSAPRIQYVLKKPKK